jgi:REP element-mobilizing transposase RayT
LFSNGDCLLALPILSEIRKEHPYALITWQVAPFSKHFLLNNPEIDVISETDEVKKYNIKSFRKYKSRILMEYKKDIWDKVYFLQPTDTNQANYDGTIRSMLYNTFGRIPTDIVPKLYLTNDEISTCSKFSVKHNLSSFNKVILFEFAPQSGQLKIELADALFIANQICKDENVAIVLSSSIKMINNNPKIIDGSELGIRETGGLLKYCHLVIGCSSGLSWMATSNIGYNIPLIQIIDPFALWVNPMSRDFKQMNITQPLIELYSFDKQTIIECVNLALSSFEQSRNKFQKELPISFRTTYVTIYNLLCYFQISSILKHLKLNIERFGFHPKLIFAIILSLLSFPFKLCRNTIVKKIYMLVRNLTTVNDNI